MASTAPTSLRELPRFKGFRGVVQLRELAPLVDPRSESPGESALRLRWLDAGLPAPELQVPVRAAGILRYRGDLGLPALRFLAEYDGREHHTTPADRAYDEQRRAWLRDRGWVVVVLTAREVLEHPERAGDVLRRGLAEAASTSAPRRVTRHGLRDTPVRPPSR